MAAGVNTSFEQFKDIYTNLGVSISHDDLQTLDLHRKLKNRLDHFLSF